MMSALCDCCGEMVPVADLRTNIWVRPHYLCSYCLRVWYDGRVAGQGSDAIAAESVRLRREGKEP